MIWSESSWAFGQGGDGHRPLHQFSRLQPPVHQLEDLFQFERFEDVVERSQTHGFNRRFRCSKGGHDDDGHLGKVLFQFFQNLEAGQVRHAVVKKDEIAVAP